MASDIRQRTEDESYFQARMFGVVKVAIIATRPNGTIVYWNPFAEELYGWQVQEVIGRNIIELMVPKENVQSAKDIIASVRAGKSWTGEFTLGRRDGTHLTVYATDSPFFDETGNLIGIVSVSHDLTALAKARPELEWQVQKRIAELQAANENLRELSSRLIQSRDEERRLFVIAVNSYSNAGSCVRRQSSQRHRGLRTDMATNRAFIGAALLVGVIVISSCGCGVPKRPVAPSQVNVSFYGAPQLMPILGTPVSYIANATQEVIHDGNLFYVRSRVPATETEDVYYHDFWFSSANVEGPWQAVSTVPEEVAQVECTELGPYNPLRTNQLCAIAFPHPEFHADDPDRDFACKLPPCP